ncbi:MAG TPA: hypothetical protein VJB92_04140 [Candidatus Paceibacterota bacterium]
MPADEMRDCLKYRGNSTIAVAAGNLEPSRNFASNVFLVGSFVCPDDGCHERASREIFHFFLLLFEEL